MNRAKNNAPEPDISDLELLAIQQQVELEISENGIPTNAELHAEIEVMNSTADTVPETYSQATFSNAEFQDGAPPSKRERRQVTKSVNPAREFAKWRKEFVSVARADGYNELRRHLEHLRLDYLPETLLQGTLMLMPAVIAYRQLDGQSIEQMLRRQKYSLEGEGLPHYCVTFDFFGLMIGRVLTGETFADIDFADLYGHPWHEIKRVGFENVWISRLDGKAIDADEFKAIGDRVLEDLFYDYDESELTVEISFADVDDSVYLWVSDAIDG